MLNTKFGRQAASHPRAVVIGAGFGGLTAAKELGGTAGISGSRVENMPRPQQSSPVPEAVRNVA